MARKFICERCGKCCLQGGPALHIQDRHLLDEKILTFDDLVTVRKGELAFQPMEEQPEIVEHEFIKIQGQPGSWICKFYDGEKSRCTIYQNRMVSCRVLECSSPEALLTIKGKNLLTRAQCIKNDDPLLPIVKEHDGQCPSPDFRQIQKDITELGHPEDDVLKELQDLVNLDLAYRTMATKKFGLSLARELFYFGRPLFQQLIPMGIVSVQHHKGLELTFRP
jgi:Fe-S-cluster containining protein